MYIYECNINIKIYFNVRILTTHFLAITNCAFFTETLIYGTGLYMVYNRKKYGT